MLLLDSYKEFFHGFYTLVFFFFFGPYCLLEIYKEDDGTTGQIFYNTDLTLEQQK